MGTSKITTPGGFRAAVEELSATLNTLSSEQAAEIADQIKGAAPRAATRFAPDDLEDMRIVVDALRNRLRRKWRRQRRNNAWSVAIGTGCTVAAGVLKGTALIPPGAVIALVVLGALLGILAMVSLYTATDWRDEVAKPVGEVADILAKRLAELSDDRGAYRSPGAGSTRIRMEPTIREAEAAEEMLAEATEPAKADGRKP